MNRDIRGAVFRMLLFLSVLVSLPGYASWEWLNPRPQGNILADVAFGNGRYVAVGHTGTVLTSADGVAWASVDTGTSAWLQALLWSDTHGRFIAVGNDGEITTSVDGTAWSPLRWEGARFLYGIAEGNGAIVAVGDGATILRSIDGGATWQRIPLDPVRDWLNDVVFANGQFVVVGSGGTILTSPDGAVWTPRPHDFGIGANDLPWRPSLEGVAYGSGTYKVVGFGIILSSPDGVTWTEDYRSPSGLPAFNDVASDGSSFLAVGQNGALRRVTAEGSWTDLTANTTEGLEALLLRGGTVIAVGDHGTIMRDWSDRTTGRREPLNGAALSDGLHVVVGDGGWVHTSAAPAPRQVGSGNPSLNAVAAGDGVFVAVGNGGSVYSGTDGTAWTRRGVGTTATLHGVAAGGGRFVAVGSNGTVLYSDDGAGWATGVNGNAVQLNAVTYTAPGFAAVGQGGAILESPDGITWATQAAPVADDLRGVAHGNGITIAVGRRGTVARSTGRGWVAHQAGTTSDLLAIAFSAGRFITVGEDGTVLASADGTAWTPLQVTGTTLRAVASAGDVVIAAGEAGALLKLDCPCAVDDFVTTGPDTPIVIDVLANDRGGNLVLTDGFDARSGHGGAVTLEGNRLRYSPPPGFTGTDSFRYTVAGTDSAGMGGEDVGNVTVQVTAARGAGSNGGGGGGSTDVGWLLAALLLVPAWRKRG